MAKTHYDTLGVTRSASSAEIKAAYRKLVLKHHPDRSKDPAAPRIFRMISEAFEVLGDPDARRHYDDVLDGDVRRAEEAAVRDKKYREDVAKRLFDEQAVPGPSQRVKSATSPVATVPGMLARLSAMFARQQIAECERLARDIIKLDPSQALPYAVLGDICRSRGNLAEAARMYSFALQMQPENAVYLKRYEEILDRTQLMEGKGQRVRIQPKEKKLFAVLTMVSITMVACLFILISGEKPALAGFGPISEWTVGILVMLFLCGVSTGTSLAVGNLIDRVDAFTSGKLAPAVILGAVAIVSFPAACILYALVGASQKAFSITTSRLVISVAMVTIAITIASWIALNTAAATQVLMWGGNLVYLGSLCGWTVADSLRG